MRLLKYLLEFAVKVKRVTFECDDCGHTWVVKLTRPTLIKDINVASFKCPKCGSKDISIEEQTENKGEYLAEAKVVVYDNGGKTVDRYTVLIGDDVYEMSDNPFSPQGFNQYVGLIGTDVVVGSHLGKKVNVDRLPEDVKRAIKERQKRR